MPRDIITQNFLYGDHSQKKRRPSIWGCKRPGESPSSSPSVQGAQKSGPLSDPSMHNRHSTPRIAQRDCTSPPGSSEDRRQTPQNSVQFGLSDPRQPSHNVSGLSPSQPDPFTMHPFSRLSTTVKQCPWMLGSDVNPFAPDHNADFHLPTPRSIKHDTAVSFVVTDQTRPEQPQFVISCPLEHVDLVREMLAPAGSQRTLSARGSSGHPRDSRELRSMLLDGTPNIELALHEKLNITADGSDGAGNSHDCRHSMGGGFSTARRESFVRERPLEASMREKNVGQRMRPQEGCVPQGSPAPFIPAMLVPPGWYNAVNHQEPHMDYTAPAFVNSLTRQPVAPDQRQW